MGVHIRKLKVKNYRGISETETLIPQTGVFFGDYLMGKTSVFEAISLALGVNYWISDISIDSFYRGMINFEEFVESEQITISLILSGFESEDHFNEYIGSGYENSLAFWDAKSKEITFSKPSCESEFAVELVFTAKMEGDQVVKKRFLATGPSSEDMNGAEPSYDKDLASLIGFFYIPFRTSNNRKWLEKDLHETLYEVDQWKEKAKDYLNAFQESHQEMVSFMDQIETLRKENKDEQSLSEDVVKFVSNQVAKLNNTSIERDVKHTSKSELLGSFRHIVEKAGLKELLQIIGANSYSLQGKCILSGLINDVVDRVEKGKPCILFLDEPESFFEETFFWKSFVELIEKEKCIDLVIATHDKVIVELFPEDERVYIHNVFGNIAVLDKVLFNGLYQ